MTSADLILFELHGKVSPILSQAGGGNHDGMDMALYMIDPKGQVLDFAGAKNPMYLLQGCTLLEVKGDKHLIGGLQKEKIVFTKHTFLWLIPLLSIYFLMAIQTNLEVVKEASL